jgi:hypothetical protein
MSAEFRRDAIRRDRQNPKTAARRRKIVGEIRFCNAKRCPTRRSRNQKLRREIRISKLEIRNNMKAEGSKRSSLDAGDLNFPRNADFRFVSRFEFRISDLSSLAHFARDFTDK